MEFRNMVMMTLYVRHKRDTDAKSRIWILWEKARVG